MNKVKSQYKIVMLFGRISALVWRRDGKIWVIGVARQGNINLNKKCNNVASGKREHKRYCNGGNKA